MLPHATSKKKGFWTPAAAGVTAKREIPFRHFGERLNPGTLSNLYCNNGGRQKLNNVSRPAVKKQFKGNS
jgi:hypothetical protein